MRYSELQRHITALKKTIAQLQAEGDVTQDCWLDSAQRKGSGTRDGQERYTRLRWMQDGKKRCRTLAPAEVSAVRAAIERGEQLRQLQQQLEESVAELDGINALVGELGLNVLKKLHPL